MKKRITLIVFSVLIIVALYVLYCFNYIPHKKYTNADFNIEAYKSNIDKDNDGIDDQTDILNNANNYIKTNPKYKSKYYNTGYPDDEYGVCTDVVAFALKDAGYDLMVLVNGEGIPFCIAAGEIWKITFVGSLFGFMKNGWISKFHSVSSFFLFFFTEILFYRSTFSQKIQCLKYN